MSELRNTPELGHVKAWLGLDEFDDADDGVLQPSLDAALRAQAEVVCYPADGFGDCYYSDDLTEAIYLRTQRLAARRNSPEGVVGLTGTGGDFVGARVPGTDAHVVALEAPYRKIPVA